MRRRARSGISPLAPAAVCAEFPDSVSPATAAAASASVRPHAASACLLLRVIDVPLDRVRTLSRAPWQLEAVRVEARLEARDDLAVEASSRPRRSRRRAGRGARSACEAGTGASPLTRVGGTICAFQLPISTSRSSDIAARDCVKMLFGSVRGTGSAFDTPRHADRHRPARGASAPARCGVDGAGGHPDAPGRARPVTDVQGTGFVPRSLVRLRLTDSRSVRRVRHRARRARGGFLVRFPSLEKCSPTAITAAGPGAAARASRCPGSCGSARRPRRSRPAADA